MRSWLTAAISIIIRIIIRSIIIRINPASVLAHNEFEHLLLVLGTQLAVWGADYTCKGAILWEQTATEMLKCSAGYLAQAAISRATHGQKMTVPTKLGTSTAYLRAW